MRAAFGIVLAFALGFACRVFGIPSPAPPALTGALLVVAMTVGHVGTGRLLALHARHAAAAARAGQATAD